MCLIQGNFGTWGNFEAVVREEDYFLAHYWRNNDDGILPWYRTGIFAQDARSEPALIQSNFGNKGNFEVVVKKGSNKLRHYWRDNDTSSRQWHIGVLFGDNVSSAPALIQSNFGNKGNFELVVREGNKLRHYWRNNDASGLPWHKGVLFGDNVRYAYALIQSNFGNKGNFEAVVREGSGIIGFPIELRHYWRNNDASGLPWHKSVTFGDHITYQPQPSLIQGNFGGRKGNFELLTMRGKCLVHFWRNNSVSGCPWSEEIQTHTEVPLGTSPTAREKAKFLRFLPNLRNWKVTAPATGRYNCIAWSVGITDEFLWPGKGTITDFDNFYASYGWNPSANGRREYNKRKIALYADWFDGKLLPRPQCKHASVERFDCDWHESKCGFWERIMHDKFQMQGGRYGNIIKYYEKHIGGNLDLA